MLFGGIRGKLELGTGDLRFWSSKGYTERDVGAMAVLRNVDRVARLDSSEVIVFESFCDSKKSSEVLEQLGEGFGNITKGDCGLGVENRTIFTVGGGRASVMIAEVRRLDCRP